jgi:hypothetical protein
MKLPPKNSRQMKIIDTVRDQGQLTLAAGIKQHGLPRRVTVADMAEIYEGLVTMGCLERVGKHYRISHPLQAYFAQPKEAPKAALPELVVPRTAPPFRPLSRRYLVSGLGTREGSNDWRGLPSKYAQLEG